MAQAGYLSPKAVFIDGTHIKANANTKKRDNTSRKKLARRKKGLRTVIRSVTDSDSGLFVKGKHKRQFAYEAHTACDKHGFILEAVVTPGNVHDGVAFDEVYEIVSEAFPEVEKVVADSAYKRPQTMKGGHKWWKYVYDEHYDCVLCPEHQVLTYRTTNRDGYREYKSEPKNCVKTVQRHIWKDYEELADDARYAPEYRAVYKRHKEAIERVFADAKEKHAMRYTQFRGLAQVTNWVKLKFVAMNLKKLAGWLCKEMLSPCAFILWAPLYVRIPVPA